MELMQKATSCDAVNVWLSLIHKELFRVSKEKFNIFGLLPNPIGVILTEIDNGVQNAECSRGLMNR